MEALICTALIVLAYLFGVWERKNKYRKRTASVCLAKYVPEDAVRKRLLQDIEVILISDCLIRKDCEEDGACQYSVEFYVKEEEV